MSNGPLLPSPVKESRKFLGMGSFGWQRAKWFYVFIAPWFVGFLAFTTIPVVVGMLMSITNFTGSNFNTLKFIGLDNYRQAFGEFFTNGDAWYTLGRTLLYAGITIPVGISLSFMFSVLLTRNISGKGFFRILFYIPHMLPVVGSIWVWKIMMHNDYGVVNAIIDLFSPDTYIRWMTEESFTVLVMWSIWSSMGGAIIIFMAGIQGVPTELEEAARMDGANPLQVLTHITIPLLTPVLFYQIVVSLIGALQILTPPLLLAPSKVAEGGMVGIATIPQREIYMYLIHIYQEAFIQQRYGYGSALLWMLFAFILVLTILVTYTSKYWVYYEVSPEDKA